MPLKGAKQFAYTFGLSREAYQKAYVREHPPRDPAVPGPGAYVDKGALGDEGSKWSMRIKPGI